MDAQGDVAADDHVALDAGSVPIGYRVMESKERTSLGMMGDLAE